MGYSCIKIEFSFWFL